MFSFKTVARYNVRDIGHLEVNEISVQLMQISLYNNGVSVATVILDRSHEIAISAGYNNFNLKIVFISCKVAVYTHLYLLFNRIRILQYKICISRISLRHISARPKYTGRDIH